MNNFKKIIYTIFPFLKSHPCYHVYGKKELSLLLKRFVSGKLEDPWEWDDFTNFPARTLQDPYEQFVLDLVLFSEFLYPAPPSKSGYSNWCGDKGVEAISRLAEAIDSNTLPFPPTEKELEEMKKDKISIRYRYIMEGENTNYSSEL